MYQEIFVKTMEELQQNKDIIIINSSNEEPTPKYFVYTDNQSNGDTIKKLCQI